MKLVYTPEGEAPQEFIFRPLEINELDAEDIEDVGGNTWDNYDEFGSAFFGGKWKAIRAALWVCMRATNPDLGFDQVKFKINEVDIFLEDEERARIKERLHEGSLSVDEAEEAKRILAAEAIGSVESGKEEAGAEDTNST